MHAKHKLDETILNAHQNFRRFSDRYVDLLSNPSGNIEVSNYYSFFEKSHGVRLTTGSMEMHSEDIVEKYKDRYVSSYYMSMPQGGSLLSLIFQVNPCQHFEYICHNHVYLDDKTYGKIIWTAFRQNGEYFKFLKENEEFVAPEDLIYKTGEVYPSIN